MPEVSSSAPRPPVLRPGEGDVAGPGRRGPGPTWPSVPRSVPRRADDPLLGGQQFGGRVAPVATGEGNDAARSGPDRARAATSGSARTRTTLSRSRKFGGQCHRFVGGDVERPGHSAEASRRVKVDPSRVTGMARESGPVRVRACRRRRSPSRRATRRAPRRGPWTTASTSADPAGGAVTSAPERRSGRQPWRGGVRLRRQGVRWSASCSAQPVAQHVGGRPAPASARGWRALRSRLPLDEVSPARSMADSMSTLRFEKARRMAFGMSRQLPQAVASHLPGETQRRQLGPQRGPVEGAGRSSSRCRGGGRRVRTTGRLRPGPDWGQPRGCGAGGRRPGWCDGGRPRR